MQRILPLFALAIVFAWSASTATAAAQNSAQQAGAAAAPQALLPTGTTIDVNLSTTVDAKKNKTGDRVEARAAEDVKVNGNVVIKKGTTLGGHITDAQARAKDQSQSDLAIVFDHVSVKKGEDVALPLMIQALGAQPSSSYSSGGDAEQGLNGGLAAQGSSAAGGGVLGGGDSGVGAAATPTGGNSGGSSSNWRSPGAVGGFTPSGRLAPNSSGVFGLDSFSLRNVGGASDGSMITSPTKNVHLDSGTQILLSVAAPAQ